MAFNPEDITSIPLSGANVIAVGSSPNQTLGNPENLQNNSTWLLADDSPGYWSASFGFSFKPTVLRLRNAVMQDGRGTKTWRFRALPDTGIMNFTYVDTATGKNRVCTPTCPMPQENHTEQVFYFVNMVNMNAFRLDISGWYGSGGGLDGIALDGLPLSSPSSKILSSATTTSTTAGTTPPPTSSPNSPTPGAPAPAQTSTPPPNTLSEPAIAGIVVGTLVIVILSLLVYWRTKRTRRRSPIGKDLSVHAPTVGYIPPGGRHELGPGFTTSWRAHEVGDTGVGEMGGGVTGEVGGRALYEMSGDGLPAQLEGEGGRRGRETEDGGGDDGR